MEQGLIAAIAVLAGIAVGFWICVLSRKSSDGMREEQFRKSAAALEDAQSALKLSQAESAARAGFEILAAEREKANLQIAAEQERLKLELRAKAADETHALSRIKELETELRNERQNLAEKLALLETAKQTLANQFQALAGEILDQKSKTFSEGNQKELGTLLTPLRDQIKEFREKVEKAQSESSTGVTKLETLIGTLGSLNQQLADEARSLSTALRGSSKTQGDWGEFILRDLLEKAGLREGEQFSFQQSHTDAAAESNGRSRTIRTDVILNLPGGRHLVIDSKVSLGAYTDCTSATDEAARAAALKLHLASVRGHVMGLAQAGYHRLAGVEAPDFIVMFVPIEPAFLLALQNDGNLWADAYKQGILLVGPTTLLYVVRIIDVLWKQELQSRSVQDVMKRGGELYDKFVSFVADMEAVGKNLRIAEASYGTAMKKLSEGRGNLIRQVEMLREKGVRTSKQLPRNLIDAAGIDEPELAIAAESDETVQ